MLNWALPPALTPLSWLSFWWGGGGGERYRVTLGYQTVADIFQVGHPKLAKQVNKRPYSPVNSYVPSCLSVQKVDFELEGGI